jgi:hypothetical protein
VPDITRKVPVAPRAKPAAEPRPRPRPHAPSSPRGKAGRRAAVALLLRRWWKIALLVLLVLLGLPLAHALLGEVAALLGGAVLFGFLLGRWTAAAR